MVGRAPFGRYSMVKCYSNKRFLTLEVCDGQLLRVICVPLPKHYYLLSGAPVGCWSNVFTMLYAIVVGKRPPARLAHLSASSLAFNDHAYVLRTLPYLPYG